MNERRWTTFGRGLLHSWGWGYIRVGLSHWGGGGGGSKGSRCILMFSRLKIVSTCTPQTRTHTRIEIGVRKETGRDGGTE